VNTVLVAASRFTFDADADATTALLLGRVDADAGAVAAWDLPWSPLGQEQERE
jgi:hypothetical protein